MIYVFKEEFSIDPSSRLHMYCGTREIGHFWSLSLLNIIIYQWTETETQGHFH